MKIGDLTELAFRNLREAVLRNSLTTLGVAVGVASLVALVSLGVGLQQLVSKRLSSSGLFNAVFVYSQADLQEARGPRRGAAAPPAASKQLDESARRDLSRLPNVTEVNPQIRFMTEIRYANNPYPTSVAGVPVSAQNDGAFDGMQGHFFSGPDADEAILHAEFAKDLTDNPSSLIGKDLVLRYAERQSLNSAGSANPGFSVVPHEKQLRIIGIVDTDPEGGFGGFGRSRVFIPLQLAQQLSATDVSDLRELVNGSSSARTYASLIVRVKTPTDVQGVEDAIKGMGFATFSLLDTTKNLRIFFFVIDILLGIFGSLALIVATLGIVNTLVMAILERRREIGVFKALGADDRDVKQLFFAEAGVMGFVGGIGGVFLGWLIGRALTFGANIYLARQNVSAVNIAAVPLWLVLGAIIFAVLVSLIAGLYPASRAARLNPVEALRYE